MCPKKYLYLEVIEMSPKKKFLNSFFLAIFVSFIGFGVMNILFYLWNVNDGYNSALPGLYAYNAATIGDGVCLPVLIFAMSYFCSLHKSENSSLQMQIHKKSVVTGCIFWVIGLLIQISWLLDADIKTNWTIPQKHHFNYAGWYHCVYFSMMFGLISYFMCKMYLLRRITIRNYFSDILNLYLFSFSGAFYLMLQRTDDLKDRYSYYLILSVISILLFLFLSIYLFSSNKEKVKYELVVCLSGISTAYGLTLVVFNLEKYYFIYALIMFLMSFSFIFEVENRFENYILKILLISIPVFLLNVALFSMPFAKGSIILLILLLIVPILNVYFSATTNKLYDNKNKFLMFCKYGIAYQLLILVSVYVPKMLDEKNEIRTLLGVVFEFGIIYLLNENIKDIFKQVISAENNREADGNEPMSRIRNLAYFQIVAIVAGATIYLLLTYTGFIEIQSIETWLELNNINFYGIIIALLLFCFSILMMYIVSKKNKKLVSIFLVFAYFFVDISIYLLKTPFSLDIKPIYFCVFFQVVGCSMLVAESFYSNIYRIRAIPFRPDFIINSIIILIGSCIMLLFTLLPSVDISGFPSRSLAYIFIGLIGNIIVLILLPCFCFAFTKPNYNSQELAPEDALGEIAKNGFLGVMIVVLAGAVPIYICLINSSKIETFSAIGSLLVGVYWAITYCLENNVKHLATREEEYEKQTNNSYLKIQLIGLEKHLRAQNICALIALLLYCLLPLFGEIILNIGKPHKSIRKKYIPKLKME